jgi:hypothetical protein
MLRKILLDHSLVGSVLVRREAHTAASELGLTKEQLSQKRKLLVGVVCFWRHVNRDTLLELVGKLPLFPLKYGLQDGFDDGPSLLCALNSPS